MNPIPVKAQSVVTDGVEAISTITIPVVAIPVVAIPVVATPVVATPVKTQPIKPLVIKGGPITMLALPVKSLMIVAPAVILSLPILI